MRRALSTLVLAAGLGSGACDGQAGRGGGVDGGAPPAAGPPVPRRLFPEPGSLTGDGLTSCSHGAERPAGEGERWCVFMVPPADPGARTGGALWVINATRVAAGAAVPCDGSSPHCLRLTGDLWMGFSTVGPIHPYAHRFYGDTLLFYADARSAPMEPHRGPVYAWRPGWAQARRISSDRALGCDAHDRALLVHCLEDVEGDPRMPDSFELRAGAIADTDAIALIPVARLRATRSTDRQPATQVAFSPAGDVLAFSSPDPDPAVETLHVVPVAALGTAAPREIARGASRWEISGDGRRVFFLREEALDESALHVVDFPSGENLTRLAARVSEYFVLGGAAPTGQAVAYVADLGQRRGAFRLLRGDRFTAAAAVTLFTFDGLLEYVRVAPDQRYSYWADQDLTVRMVRHADLASCELNAQPGRPAYGPALTASSGRVFWAEDAGGDRDRRDGYHGDPDGCRDKQRFARNVQLIAPVGDRGVVYLDELDDDTQRGTLKYARLGGAGKGLSPEGGVVIRGDLDGSTLSAAGSPASPLLLFEVTAGDPQERGTYVFGPVPF